MRVRLEPKGYEVEPLRRTWESALAAKRSCFYLARERGAVCESSVLAAAPRSFADLPNELALGVAKAVALEVRGKPQGPPMSAPLGVRCASVRSNGKVRVLTLTGQRVPVDVATSDRAKLAGVKIRNLSFLLFEEDRNEWFLVVPERSVRRDGPTHDRERDAPEPHEGPVCCNCGKPVEVWSEPNRDGATGWCPNGGCGTTVVCESADRRVECRSRPDGTPALCE